MRDEKQIMAQFGVGVKSDVKQMENVKNRLLGYAGAERNVEFRTAEGVIDKKQIFRWVTM